MADLEGAEGYKPSAEYVEDSNDALINLTDSTELLFLKLPSSNVSFSFMPLFGYLFWTESELLIPTKWKRKITKDWYCCSSQSGKSSVVSSKFKK